MFTKYLLEVYGPDSIREVVGVFESDKPFSQMQKGEFINPHGWKENTIPMDQRLQIIAVEHIIFTVGKVSTNQVMIYTKAVLVEELFDSMKRDGENGQKTH
jgi:hypothetical protein